MREADWFGVPENGSLPWSDIDRRDGFFHLSTRAQTLATAARYFGGRTDLVALEMAYADLSDNCRLEPVAAHGGERFPHYYGEIPAGAVRRVMRLIATAGGGFEFGAVLS